MAEVFNCLRTKKTRRFWLHFFLTVVFSIFAAQAQADALGQNQSFYTDSRYDAQGRTQITATLRHISGRAYFYIEDTYWNSVSQTLRDQIIGQVNALAQEFDNRIYPVETNFFGSEPNPGIDNDPKITIILEPLIESAGGYFDTSHGYSRKLVPTSNEREIIYLNIGTLVDRKRINVFLAHEFQHLIAFNQKEKLRNVSDDTWLNELRSEYAASLLAYNDNLEDSSLGRRLLGLINNPSDSLTEWKNLPPDYGQVALFGEYLSDHWSSQVIADSLKSDLIGIASINEALTKNGFRETFIDVFRYWLVANFLNDTSGNPKFGYRRPELKNFQVAATRVFNNLGDDVTFVENVLTKDWQGRWYDISQFATGASRILKIKFSSSSLTSFYIPYLVFRDDGSVKILTFEPSYSADTLYLDSVGYDLSRVVLMPIKKDKIAGFTASEKPLSLTFTVERIKIAPMATPSPSPTPIISPVGKPADFGLKEGDFIRAEGDNDVYIINDFGFKRLVLSPKICLQYGHLGRRGCFGAIKVVKPSVRDAFKTSWFFTNGETRDGKVYYLEVTGEDDAVLHYLNISGDDFVGQGGDFRSVFLFNTREQGSYQLGPKYSKLP